MTSQTWVIRLPLARPLTLNARQHWAVKAREVRQLRGDTLLLLRSQRIGHHDRVDVALTYYPKDRRRRDSDNLVATLKVACDAMIDAQIVDDDDPAHMVKHMPVIAAPDGDPRLELTVTPLFPVLSAPSKDGRADVK